MNYQIRLNLRDFLFHHRNPLVWYLRMRHQCTHLGLAVRYCYCDPFARRHAQELQGAVFYEWADGVYEERDQ